MSKRRSHTSKRARRERKRYTTYISSRFEDAIDVRKAGSWPIVRAYVPLEDCWRATGYGTAGIVRQRPDGKLITSFFVIGLVDGGLSARFGDDSADLAKVDKDIESIRHSMPPTEIGDPDLASRFAWGAYALNRELGYDWPPDEINRYLKLVPPLSGRSTWWLQQFIGPDGLAPAGLWECIKDLVDTNDEIAKGKEAAVLTEMTFRVGDRSRCLELLMTRSEDFHHDGFKDDANWFAWTREYPRNHWSPLRLLGGRQIIGNLRVQTDARLIAETKTISMGAVLVGKLKELLGDSMHLECAKWTDLSKILRARNEH